MKKILMSLVILSILLINSFSVSAETKTADFGEATQRATAYLRTSTYSATAKTTPAASGIDVWTQVRINKLSWNYGGSSATATVDAITLPVSADSYHYCGTYSYFLTAYF